MKVWEVLGIEKTKDKDIIVEAYRRMLQFNNPEDNQEGFIELRSAYEEALRYSDKSDDDIYESLINNLENIYNDFRKRVSVDEWNNILKDDLFNGLDTRTDAENNLIMFLMNNFRLPKEVFFTLSKEFEWESRFDELSENFPEGFFHYVFDVIKNGEFYNMKYFDGDDYADYDMFIEKCMNFASVIENNVDSALEMIDEIESLEIYHPFYIESKAELFYKIEKFEDAYEITDNFLSDYPNEERLLNLRMKILLALDKLEEAEAVYFALMKLNAKNRLAILYTIVKDSKDDLINAKEKFYQFVRAYDIGDDALEIANRFNERLIPYYEDRFESLNEKDKLNLAWAYYEKDNFSKTNEILEKFTPCESEVLKWRYYKIKGYISGILGNYEDSIKYVELWLEMNEKRDCLLNEKGEEIFFIVDELQKEKNEKYDLISMNRTLSISYAGIGDIEKSIEIAKNIIKLDNRNLDSYIFFNKLCLDNGKFNEAVKLNIEAMRENGEVYAILYFTGILKFHLGDYADAWRYLSEAQEMNNQISKINFYKLIILEAWGDIDGFINILNEEKNNNSMNDEILELFDIKYERLTGAESLENLEQKLLNLISRVEEAEDLYFLYEKSIFYFELSKIYDSIGSIENALKYIEKANEEFKNDYTFELEKGLLLVKNEKLDEAINHYRYLIENREPDSIYNVRLASALSRNEKPLEAIEEYKKAIEIEPDRDMIYIYLSNVYADIGEVDKSLECKTKAIELNGDFDNYMDRGVLLHNMNKNEEAINDAKKAIEILGDNKTGSSDAYTLLGICNAALKNYEEAEKYYIEAQKYLELPNCYFDTFVYQIILYTRINKYEEIISLINRYFEISPDIKNNWPWINLKLASAYYKIGNIREAEEIYSKLLHDKEDIAINMEYAVFLCMTGKRLEGLTHLLSLPQKEEITHNIGFYNYMLLGDFKEASNYYKKSRKNLELKDLYDYFNTINEFEAMWYEIRSKNGKINEDLSVNKGIFVNIKETKINAFFKDIKNMVETYYKENGKYHEESKRYYSLLAESYFYLGEYDKAEKFANYCINALVPDYDENGDEYDAYYILGMIREIKGDYKGAFKYYSIIKENISYSIFIQAFERIQKKLN